MTETARTRTYAMLAVAIGAALSAMLAELGARQWFSNDVSLYRMESPLYHHALRPLAAATDAREEFAVHYHIDQHGMRIARDDDPQRSAGGGLLVLGDSFAEGAGVEYEQSLAYLAGRELRMRVFNGAVASYSPLIHYVWAKRNVDEMRPDIVLLLLDISDVQDDFLYESLAVLDRSGDPVAVDADPVCWDRPSCAALDTEADAQWLSPLVRAWIRDSCRACTVVKQAIDRLGAPPDALVYPEDQCSLRLDRLAPIRESCPPAGWSRTLHWVDRIHELLRARGVPLVLVTWPWPQQVAGDEWDLGRSRYLFEPGAVYREDRFDAFVAAFSAHRRLPHLSLYRAFREAKARQPTVRLYYRDDPHFTPEGHAIAARAIVGGLRATWFTSRGGA